MNKPLRHASAIPLALLVVVVCSAQENSKQTCLIEAGIFRIPRTDIDTIGIRNEADAGSEIEMWRPGEPYSVIDPSATVGEFNALMFALNQIDATTGNENSDVLRIGFPQIINKLNEEASITIWTPVNYFDPNDDGTFMLNAELKQGMELGVTVTLFDDGHLVMGINLSVEYFDRREKLEGVELDVGRPVMNKTEVTNTIRVAQGQTSVQVVDSGEQGLLLILLKASVQ